MLRLSLMSFDERDISKKISGYGFWKSSLKGVKSQNSQSWHANFAYYPYLPSLLEESALYRSTFL